MIVAAGTPAGSTATAAQDRHGGRVAEPRPALVAVDSGALDLAPETSASGVDGEALRSVMRRVPSGLAIVTCTNGREARGMTVNTLTSVSLSPPLVAFNVARDAQMHTTLEDALGFAVHVPGVHQAELCRRFAAPNRSGREQFASVLYGFDQNGNPVLGGVLAVLRCHLRSRITAGDHTVIIGLVVDAQQRDGGAPLLYFDGEYRQVGVSLASS